MEAIKLGTPERVNDKIRWRKMHKGRRWQSSLYAEDSRRNRSEAWSYFLSWRNDINQEIVTEKESLKSVKRKQLDQQIQTIEDNADFWELLNQSPLSDQYRSIIRKIKRVADQDEDFAEEILGRPSIKKSISDEGFINRSIMMKESRKNQSTELTCERVAAEFLKTHRTRLKTKAISVGRYGKIRCDLKKFVDWFGGSNSMTTISEATVKDYFDHVMGLVIEGECCGDQFGLMKQFIDEVSDDYPEIPKPKNLRSKRFIIPKKRTEPDPFTPEEFKLIYRHATERTKLYLLLQLNCSMYQGDLAELHAKEIDWEQGRIIRARSKKRKIMEKRGHKPIKINYKLWDETFRLLKQFGHREGLVLRNEKGGSLISYGLKKNDVEWRNDNVSSAYDRVIVSLKNKKLLPKSFKKPLKQLRKTGPNVLAESKHAEFVEVMLDHNSVANRSYLKSGKPYKPFDEALEFVGKTFGF